MVVVIVDAAWLSSSLRVLADTTSSWSPPSRGCSCYCHSCAAAMWSSFSLQRGRGFRFLFAATVVAWLLMLMCY
jgi:hypothetical protein